MDEAGAVTPHGFRIPAGDHRIEGGFRFAVGTIATEATTVGRARKDDVHAAADVGVCGDLAQTGNEFFHRPQQQAHFVFGAGADVCQGTHDARGGEGEQQGRHECRLDLLLLPIDGGGLFVADPFDQGIEITVAGQVRGGHPQCRVAAGVVAVQVLVVAQACMPKRAGGHNDRCALLQKVGHHRCGDGVRRCAGDHRDVISQRQAAGIARCGCVCAEAPIVGLGCDGFACSGE